MQLISRLLEITLSGLHRRRMNRGVLIQQMIGMKGEHYTQADSQKSKYHTSISSTFILSLLNCASLVYLKRYSIQEIYVTYLHPTCSLSSKTNVANSKDMFRRSKHWIQFVYRRWESECFTSMGLLARDGYHVHMSPNDPSAVRFDEHTDRPNFPVCTLSVQGTVFDTFSAGAFSAPVSRICRAQFTINIAGQPSRITSTCYAIQFPCLPSVPLVVTTFVRLYHCWLLSLQDLVIQVSNRRSRMQCNECRS